MLLSKDDILKADDLKSEVVSVPEWGGDVRVRALSGTERDAYEASVMVQRGRDVTMNLRNARAKLVAVACVDGNGERLFDDGDVLALGRKSAAALARVFEVAQRLAGLTAEDVEELAKNSGSDQSEDSGLR